MHRWPTDFEHGWPHVISLAPLVPNASVQYQTGAPVSRAAFKQRARRVSALHHAAEVAHALAVGVGIDPIVTLEKQPLNTIGTIV